MIPLVTWNHLTWNHLELAKGENEFKPTVFLPEPPLPPKRTTSELDRTDPGSKSEGEEDSSQQGIVTTINVNNAGPSTKSAAAKATLGRTPNHLTLSTTSTLSVGSTGSQARLIQSSHPPSSYQPVLMKDLGKKHSFSPTQEQEAPVYSNLNEIVERNDGSTHTTATDTDICKNEERSMSYEDMDRHLNALHVTGVGSKCDIVDYMQHLKEKHLGINRRPTGKEEVEATDLDPSTSNDSLPQITELKDVGVTSVKEQREKESHSSDINKSLEFSDESKIGNQTTTTTSTTPTGTTPKTKTNHKADRLILNIDSVDLAASTSPIKIIKVKSRSRSTSPRRQNGDLPKVGKTKDKATGELQTGKTHGILKRSSSAKSMESSTDLLSVNAPTGILKRSFSPNEMARLDGLSPRNSFDSRASPSRSPEFCCSPSSQQMTTDYKNPILIVKARTTGKGHNKSSNRKRSSSASASVCNSFDSESSFMSENHKRRSLSTSNFDQNQMSSMDSEMSLLSPNYYYNRTCFSSANSLQSYNSIDNEYGSVSNSKEHLSQTQPDSSAPRRQSTTSYDSAKPKRRRSHSPNEAILTKAIEQPTCMDCYLQTRKVS